MGHKMRRFLFVLPCFIPDTSGYAHAFAGFIESLRARSHDSIDILTLKHDDGTAEKENILGCTVYRLRLRSIKLQAIVTEIQLWKKIMALQATQFYDFIVFETADYPFAAYLAARKFGKRMMVRIHGCAETEWTIYRNEWEFRWRRYWSRRMYDKTTNICATSTYYLDYVQNYFLFGNPLKISTKNYFILPNIAFTGTGDKPENMPCIPEHIKSLISNEHITFLTLGRLDVYGEIQKNIKRLLLALSALKRMHYFPRVRLLCVGNGNLLPYLKQLAIESGVQSNIIFTGPLSHAAVTFLEHHCAAVILPSTFEGQSMFALESLAAGAPLLLSRVGGLTNMVNPEINGLLFDPLNIDSIANAINQYIIGMHGNHEAVRKQSLIHHNKYFKPDSIIDCFIQTVEMIESDINASFELLSGSRAN